MSFQSRVSHKGYARVSPERGLVDYCSLEVAKRTALFSPDGKLETVRNKLLLEAIGECALGPQHKAAIGGSREVHEDTFMDFLRLHTNVEVLGGSAAKEAAAVAAMNERDRRLAELEPDDASVMVAIEAMGGAAAVLRQEVAQS